MDSEKMEMRFQEFPEKKKSHSVPTANTLPTSATSCRSSEINIRAKDVRDPRTGIKWSPVSFVITCGLFALGFMNMDVGFDPIDEWHDVFTNKYWYIPLIYVAFLISTEFLHDSTIAQHVLLYRPQQFTAGDMWTLSCHVVALVVSTVNYGANFVITFGNILLFGSVVHFGMQYAIYMIFHRKSYFRKNQTSIDSWDVAYHTLWVTIFMIILPCHICALAYLDQSFTPASSWPFFCRILIQDGIFYILHRMRHMGLLCYGCHRRHHEEERIPVGLMKYIILEDLHEATIGYCALYFLFPGLAIEPCPIFFLAVILFIPLTVLLHHEVYIEFGIFNNFFVAADYHHQIHHLCGHVWDCNHCQTTPLWDFIWGTKLRWKDVPEMYKMTAAQILHDRFCNPECLGLPGIDKYMQIIAKNSCRQEVSSRDAIHQEVYDTEDIKLLRSNGKVICLLQGGVYDVTKFAHPGGMEIIKSIKEDAIKKFEEIHNGNTAKFRATDYFVGVKLGEKFKPLVKNVMDQLAEESFNYERDLQPSLVWGLISLLAVVGYSLYFLQGQLKGCDTYEMLEEFTCSISSKSGVNCGNYINNFIEKSKDVIHYRYVEKCLVAVLFTMIGVLMRSTYSIKIFTKYILGNSGSLDPTTPTQLKIIGKRRLSSDIAELTLFCPENMGLACGNHINVQYNTDKSKVVRTYTPIWEIDFDQDEQPIAKHANLRLIIKVYPDGQMGKYISSRHLGNYLDITGPLGEIVYHGGGTFSVGEDKHRHDSYLMIVGGSAATCALQLLQKAYLEPMQTHMHLVVLFCGSKESDIILIEECMQYSTHPKIDVHFTVSKDVSESWKYFKGRVSEKLIDKIVPKDCMSLGIGYCGPPNFNTAVANIIPKYSPSEIYKF